MQITSAATRIGWIGTGVMGRSMCGHLVKAGYPMTVFNRTKSRADDLLAQGAVWADSPRDVSAASDVVFTIVGYPEDVREVILGKEGVLAGCREGSVVVDMTTSQPALAEEIATTAAAKGVVSLDAPVTGGDIGAKNAKLSIMIGGDAGTVRALKPLWELMGAKWVLHGGPGAGQRTKIVNQTLIAAGMVAVCEGLLFAYRAGLDMEKVMESVASGAAGSFSLTAYGPRIIAGDFKPGFFVEHMIKDLGIVLEEARRMELKLPGVELAEALYRNLAEQGHARDGTQSLILALAKLSGIEWKR